MSGRQNEKGRGRRQRRRSRRERGEEEVIERRRYKRKRRRMSTKYPFKLKGNESNHVRQAEVLTRDLHTYHHYLLIHLQCWKAWKYGKSTGM
jgi:hypothetical protein